MSERIESSLPREDERKAYRLRPAKRYTFKGKIYYCAKCMHCGSVYHMLSDTYFTSRYCALCDQKQKAASFD